MGDSIGSVSQWLLKVRNGDEEAAAELWKAYFSRLTALVRARLRSRPRRVLDEEDIALSAFDSFFRAARAGRFPDLNDRHDLWQVLVMLAMRKTAEAGRRETRRKRGSGTVRGHSALIGTDARDDARTPFDTLDTKPSPELAAALAEDFATLILRLNDDTLQRIALWKLEGYSNSEIADRLGRQPRTVERKLHLIRTIWLETAAETA